MNIQLFSAADDIRKINKTLTAITETVPCNVKDDDFSIITPKVILKYSAAYLTANYCYIPDFSRYYFITDISMLTGGMCELTLTLDVLYTYREQINGLQVTASRSSNKYNRYLQDDQQITTNNPLNQIKMFKGLPFNPAVLGTGSRCFVVQIGKSYSGGETNGTF